MLITICYIYLTYVTNHLKKSQLDTLIAMLSTKVPKASLLFQRVLLSQSLGRMPRILKPGALSISQFCDDGLESIAALTVMEKGSKQVLEISPKQYVNLSQDWTLFIGSKTPILQEDNPSLKLTDQSDMFLLIEATPPYKDKYGRVYLRKVPAEKAVKLSRLTTPIAWKSGEPFGIVVKASVAQCAKTGIAFLDGVLELDDGLLVEHIATVGISGKANSLLSRKTSFHTPAKPINASENQISSPSVQNRHQIHDVVSEQDMDRKTSTSSLLMKNVQPSCNDSRPDAHRIPNVLVYTDSDEQEPGHYLMVKQMLQKCLHPDHYVIYHLTKTQILNHPWVGNTALIVLSSELEMNKSAKVTEKLKSFLATGGKVLSFSSRLCAPDCVKLSKQTWHTSVVDVEYYNAVSGSTTYLKSLHRDYSFNVNQDTERNYRNFTIIARCNSQPIILEVRSKGEGIAVLCQVRLDLDPTTDKTTNSNEFAELKKSNEARYEVLLDIFSRLGIICAVDSALPLSPSYLLAQSERTKKSFLNSIEGQLREGLLKSRLTNLQFVKDFPSDQEPDPECIPVITTEVSNATTFDMDAYWSHLHTKVLGNVVLYSEVVPTTMSLFEGFMFHVDNNIGTVAIATKMTQGKGRGGNKWISPRGCAMFSSHVRIPIHSHLGQRLPYLQHIASSAVVEAVRSLIGYENIDLRLKWPNDIYFGNKMKLGGVIVNSCCWEKQFHAIIGCGFNVSNSDPTICINDLVSRHNQEHGTSLLPLTRELLIARTLTYMEKIIEDFQMFGKESFLPGYYKQWLHSGMKVHLENDDGPEVEVVGLDDMGFLAVKDQCGQVVSVQPDGNSFDMMKNLIVTKARP
ncbi:biotin--protein ligase-like [Anneissia japonica]|uniref:biotin--protein ligase-like n=1 Tax=Anneissia japonica TaxID=1529436 RepID=UPI001425A9C0|nr:biotin--protein ligase-like [Anneissia japonica]XP_033111684.1 biotin--protein ligase-like [Anneissia japonica]